MLKVRRRELLGGAAAFMAVGAASSRAQIMTGLPWRPDEAFPPTPATAGPWLFFTVAEAAAIEALVDRLIPPDPQTPGGKDAGCAVYIDRQLAGPYGSRRGLYVSGPFLKGASNQGPQSQDNPAQEYRRALAALDAYARSNKGDVFANSPPTFRISFSTASRRERSRSRGSTAVRFSRPFSRTRRKASSPIRSTAATVTCAGGK